MTCTCRALNCVRLLLPRPALSIIFPPRTDARTIPIGLHFDVEPQALQQWNNASYSQTDIINTLIDLISELDARWTANNRPKPWTWDAPNWYSLYSVTRNGVSKSYAEWVRK